MALSQQIDMGSQRFPRSDAVARRVPAKDVRDHPQTSRRSSPARKNAAPLERAIYRDFVSPSLRVPTLRLRQEIEIE